MLLDASSIESDAQIACDICIVGAGAAGVTIARRLSESKLSVLLIESGGFEPDVTTQRLYRGKNVGHPYYEIDACRSRYFGGSTNRWGGWLRPLDAVDFARHDWLEWSGWPIAENDLRPYYDHAAHLLGLSQPSFDVERWQARLDKPLPLDGTNFHNSIFQYKALNFGETYRDNLVNASNVSVMLHANLTNIGLAEASDRVETLYISTLTGRRFTIHPRNVVLATGGIENARILLASNRSRPAGIGNENDLVGRFFMEHLHVAAGHLVTSCSANNNFYQRTRLDNLRVGGVISPNPDALDRHQLLTTSITLEDASYTVGPQRMSAPSAFNYELLRLYGRAKRGSLKPLTESAKLAAVNIANASRRLRTWKKSRSARSRVNLLQVTSHIRSLYFRSAQAPDPTSRVMLSNQQDALGVPEVLLDWRVKARDLASIERWINILSDDVESRNLGLVIPPLEGWHSEVVGGPHHMGTTRMSNDPKRGVVDANCRVHSVDNLYVVGSSVFATGGYANPTFTIVALALRLADHLVNLHHVSSIAKRSTHA